MSGDPYRRRLPEISDETLFAALRGTRPYTLVILKAGPRFEPRGSRSPEIAAIVLEHGRRNFALREAGLLPVVCPIADGSSVTGIGLFTTDVDETGRIMESDPGVQAGVFTFELHPTQSFPGSTLP